jgi:hypothetical protein
LSTQCHRASRVEFSPCHSFGSGERWSDTDKALLNAQQRPRIVSNRLLTILKAVAGMEINGRHEIPVHPLPQRGDGTKRAALRGIEVDGGGLRRRGREERGVRQLRHLRHGLDRNGVCYEDDPAGLYREESINPLEMYWDHSVRKKNLDGSQRLARAKEIPVRDAMQLFPGKTRQQLDAVWAIGTELDKAVKSIEQKRIRDTDQGGTGLDHYDDNAKVMIVEMQWVEREVFYLIADEETQTKLQISEKQHAHMQANAQKIQDRLGNGIQVMPPAARMTRKVYKRAFLGNELLQKGPAPIKGRYSWACITGELDRNKGHWFGLIKTMRDPQMWANKWLSRILHILNTMARAASWPR